MTSIKKASSKALALAIVTGLAGASFAVQAAPTGSLNVTATVNATCDFVTSSAVAFGGLTAGVNNDVAGSVNWNCTSGTTATIFMNGGSSGSSAARVMNGDNTAGTLAYQLYTNAGRTTVWTETVGVGITGTGYTALGTSTPVYGRVLSTGFGNAIPDTYADIVTVTITL